MRRWLLSVVAVLAAACRSVPTPSVGTPDGTCDGYPADATRPMTEGAVLYPYSWPQATDLATGRTLPLDLGEVPCATDPDIDWSPFDVLLFVSIPAW